MSFSANQWDELYNRYEAAEHAAMESKLLEKNGLIMSSSQKNLMTRYESAMLERQKISDEMIKALKTIF